MTTNIKPTIADEAKRIVDGARRGAYGTPERNFERICILWNAYLEAKGYMLIDATKDPTTGPHQVVLLASDISPMMRLMKEARIIESPQHYDSHVDLVGYTLTGAEVNGVQPPVASPDPVPSSSQADHQDEDGA